MQLSGRFVRNTVGIELQTKSPFIFNEQSNQMCPDVMIHVSHVAHVQMFQYNWHHPVINSNHSQGGRLKKE